MVSLLDVVVAACAAVAVWCWWPPLDDSLQRVRGRPDPGLSRPPSWRRLVNGRPDAAPLRRRLLLGGVAAAAVCTGLTRVGGAPGWWAVAVWPLVTLGVAISMGWLEPAATRHRHRALVLQVPQALELLAACLSAGMPVRNACAAVCSVMDGPVAEDLRQVLSATALGVAEPAAWHALRDHPQLGPAALDLARSVDSGTRLVEGLQHHARLAREQRRAALQVRARAVGVRSVLPLMTCFIPSFLLLGVVPTVVSALATALR